MSRDKRDGGMVLLEEPHFDQMNPWGQPVVGWLPTSQGVGGIQNHRGWAMLRTVLWKLDEGGNPIPLYDQPVIVEKPGAIVIATVGDRIGLIQSYRMVAERLMPESGNDYIRRLQSEERWGELVESTGKWMWEAPRGLIDGDPKEMDAEAFVIKSAKLEAAEEAGFRLKGARLVGRVNVNPTFYLHSQWVVHAEIESVGDARPENLEIIGDKRLFTMDDLRAASIDGTFDDGLTLAGMALCGMSL